MKKWMKSAAAVGFLVLFLPYTMTLLINGRQGIHREKELPQLEYQVLSCLLLEDYSWMEDGTLDLMAILYRTECLRTQNEKKETEEGMRSVYDKDYQRIYDAVVRTEGQVVTIDGVYKELPYHVVSAGRTREGTLLGGSYAYVRSAECPYDKESGAYLKNYQISKEDLSKVLGEDFVMEVVDVERDSSDYVSRIRVADTEWKGEEFRAMLHLPSSCFFLEEEDGEIWVTVKGSGHGFGMSLYTANRMIQEGAQPSEIFQTFYQDSACITIP